MNKFLISIIIILGSVSLNASIIGWLDFSDIPETRKHIKEETLTIIQGCKKKESYDRAKNFGAIEYIVKACSISKKLPIASDEKSLCDYISDENLENMKLICSKNGVGQKYSEEDLALQYNKFLAKAPNCMDQHSCFQLFINKFSLEHANEFDCLSKFRLSYDLMCEVANKKKA